MAKTTCINFSSSPIKDALSGFDAYLVTYAAVRDLLSTLSTSTMKESLVMVRQTSLISDFFM